MDALVTWLRASDRSQNDLAKLLGTTRQAVQSWCVGRVAPGLYYAMAIESVSHGQVPLSSWLSQEQRLAVAGLATVGKKE